MKQVTSILIGLTVTVVGVFIGLTVYNKWQEKKAKKAAEAGAAKK